MKQAGMILCAMLLTGTMLAQNATGPTLDNASSADWPQWRGPNRDGVIVGGPKLLENWPANGPRLVWTNGTIPASPRAGGMAESGNSSITVSGGKVFVYCCRMLWEPKKLITPAFVAEWGWAPDMPAELVKRVEAARMSGERKKAGGQGEKSPGVNAYIKEFLSTLDKTQTEKFGNAISNRLVKGGMAWTWETMTALGKNAGKEISSPGEFDALFNGTDVHHCQPLQGERSGLRDKSQHFADVVFCLDAVTGKNIWQSKEFPGSATPIWGDAFLSCGTPAVSGGRCYATGSTGLYCFNVKDGSLVWRVGTRYSNSSPLVHDGKVFVLASMSEVPVPQLGGTLTAYDAESGKMVWTQPRISSGWGSSPVLWKAGGTNYLIANSDGGVFCVNPKNGDILWQGPGGGSSTPAISGDILVMDNGDKKRAFRITPEKAGLLWEKPGNTDRQGSPAIYKGFAFFDSAYQGGTSCLDLMTGEEKWRQRNAGHCSSLILADGKIFAASDVECAQPREGNGNVWAFKAVPEKFEEVGRFHGRLAWCATPTMADGKLFVRQVDRVACYDLTAK